MFQFFRSSDFLEDLGWHWRNFFLKVIFAFRSIYWNQLLGYFRFFPLMLTSDKWNFFRRMFINLLYVDFLLGLLSYKFLANFIIYNKWPFSAITFVNSWLNIILILLTYHFIAVMSFLEIRNSYDSKFLIWFTISFLRRSLLW